MPSSVMPQGVEHNLECPKTNEEFRELARQVAAIAARCWVNVRDGTITDNYWHRINSNAQTLWRIANDACTRHSPADDYSDLRDALRHPPDERPGLLPAVDERGDPGGGEADRTGLA